MSDLARALIADLGPTDLGELLDALIESAPDRVVATLAARLLPFIEPQASVGWMNTEVAARYVGLDTGNALHKIARSGAINYEQAGPNAKLWFRREDLDAYRRGDRRV